MYENFYLKKLYPLQDSILNILESLGTHFYLTGGTALSRCYLNHRYSDDLDFFVNDLTTFKDELIKVQTNIDINYELEIQHSGEKFQRMIVKKDEVILKLDFINDVPFHFGEIISSGVFNRVDNQLNILSNKITAIMDRDETKDFADILAIANHFDKIDWRVMFVSASSKSAGIFAPLFAEKLSHFDFGRLEQIKWNKNYDWKKLESKKEEIVNLIIGL